MKPQMKDALAVARANETLAEFRTCNRREHKAPRTVTGKQQHRTGHVDEAFAILAGGHRRRRNRQDFVDKGGGSARDATRSASDHEPTEIGTTKCAQACAAQYIQVGDGITRKNEGVKRQRMSAVLFAREFKILPRLRRCHAVEIAMTSAVAADFMAALRVYDLLNHVGGIPAPFISWLRAGGLFLEETLAHAP